jgi:hypothetical protein
MSHGFATAPFSFVALFRGTYLGNLPGKDPSDVIWRRSDNTFWGLASILGWGVCAFPPVMDMHRPTKTELPWPY